MPEELHSLCQNKTPAICSVVVTALSTFRLACRCLANMYFGTQGIQPGWRSISSSPLRNAPALLALKSLHNIQVWPALQLEAVIPRYQVPMRRILPMPMQPLARDFLRHTRK